MQKTQEVIFITSPLESEHVARIRAEAPAGVSVEYLPEIMPKTRYAGDHKGVADFLRDAAAEVKWREQLGRATILWDFPAGPVENGGGLALAPNVRWVQTTSSGVGQLVKALGLAESEVIVTTARGVHATPLAEFAIMALLMHTKRLVYLLAEQKAHRWERYCGESLAGKTMLVIGAGLVGAEVARLAKAFGMSVTALVNRPSADRKSQLNADFVIGKDALMGAAATADCIALCTPHTPETDQMISAEVIAAMKPGVIFINISRGQVVDERALIEALASRRIGFAALDVAAIEPLPAGSPLWDMPNVLISPHSASTVAEENAKLTDIFMANLKHYLGGNPGLMINVLDKQKMY